MRIAIPVANGILSQHFGHCEKFAIIDVDEEAKTILNTEELDAPPHQPDMLPRWLGERKVNIVISCGMGHRAQSLFEQQNIAVLTGAPPVSPESLVGHYLNGTLVTGSNVCDH